MNKVTVFGTSWCPDVRRARQLLDREEVDYDFIDIDQDSEGETFVLDANDGRRRVPTIVIESGDDKKIMGNPSRSELEAAIEGTAA